MLTDFLGLTLTAESETSMTFLQWRTLMNGVDCNSNMELIDGALSRLNTLANGKADGFTLDPDTGELQLTTGGVAIDGAVVTINLSKYYTKEEVQAELAALDERITNMEERLAVVEEELRGKADGLTLDPETGDLQLTSDGEAIDGAVVTINLKQYYTKDETDEKLSELEGTFSSSESISEIRNAALGELTYNGDTGALTMFNLNGDQVGDVITITGGGGSATGFSSRLISGMKSNTFTTASSSNTVLKATYYLYFGDEVQDTTGNLTVSYRLSGESDWIEYESKSVQSGVEFTVDVTSILTTGSTTDVVLSVENEDVETPSTRTYYITQVEASVAAVNFDSAATYTGNFDFQYRPVGRNLAKTMHFIIDGSEIAAVDIGTAHNTTLTQHIPMAGNYAYGSHDFEVYFTTSDGALSNIMRYSILYNDGTSTDPIIAVVAENTEITYGDAINIQYVLFTPGQETTDELVIRVYTETELGEVEYDRSTLTDIPNNTMLMWQGNLYPDSGDVFVEFSSGDVVETEIISISEIETEYDLHPVSANLVYAFSASGRSNNDSEKSLYEYLYTDTNGVVTKIRGVNDGFNWVSNGYVDGASLMLSGTAKHTIELPMFSTSYVDSNGQSVSLESASGATVTTNGRTFEAEFKVTNVTDINATIIECMSEDHAGFRVTPQNCYLLSSNGADVVLDETGFIENEESIAAAYIKDGTRIRLSFVIGPKGLESYQDDNGVTRSVQCIDIYINGEFANSFVYADNARFAQSEFIHFGSDSCILNLYDVRIYNRALTTDEILQNYNSSPVLVSDRLERFEDNDVISDSGEVDYYKAIKKYNCLLCTGPLSPYKGASGVKTDGKYECGWTLTKPIGDDGYVTEFELLDKTDDGVWVGANNVQGTSSVKFPVKNYKVYLAKLDADGSVKKVKYSLKGLDEEGNALSIPESTLCWKGDYMSSDHANTFNANLVNSLYTVKTAAQEDDPRVQNSIYGFRCLLFQRDDENGEIKFIGDGALNNDKGNTKTFGLELDTDSGNNTTRQKWEYLNNTEALCSFLTDKLFEVVTTEDGDMYRVVAGLESCYPDQGDLEDAGLTPNYEYIQTLYTWVCQRANFWDASDAELETPIIYNGGEYTSERSYRKAIFLNEFDKHFSREHVLIYYLFSEFVALTDNRAKNMFMQSMDVTAESLVNTDGEPMSIMDAVNMSTGEVNADMVDWENSSFAVWMPVLYDLDSCFGVENSGYLQIPYYADWQYKLNNTQKFNGSESVFWLMVEEALAGDIQAKAQSITEDKDTGALNYETLYKVHIEDNAKLVCPAVVNEDMDTKFHRPLIDGYMDYSTNKMSHVNYKYMQRGSRTEQKDAFIYRRSNMIYSKYKCGKFQNNNINFRCGLDGGVPAANSGITITANQTLYPAVKFGDGAAALIPAPKTPANTPVTIVKPGSTDGDKVGFSDTVYIAGGTFLTDIGDISKFHPYELQLQNATNLKKLTIGSSESGYENAQLKEVDTFACRILEEINIMGCTALGAVNLSANGLLKRVYAGNSSANAIILPNGGVLEELELGSVVDIEVLNHRNLESFSCDSYDRLVSLRVENTPNIPTCDIVSQRLDMLTGGLRLVGIDWTVSDTSVLDKLIGVGARGKYIDNNGVLSEDKNVYPYISGTIRCESIGSHLLSEFNTIYPDITIVADSVVTQFVVDFVNWDGTLLDRQYVYRGSNAVDPVLRDDNPIDTPIRESTVSTVFTYSGWDITFGLISSDTIVTAQYNETPRQYTVRWYNGDNLLQTTVADYGSDAEYTGDTPTDTSQETYLTYKLFSGWDNNTHFVNGDINAHAKFTEAVAPADKNLSDMNPTELYALIRTGVLSPAGTSNTIIANGDEISIPLGRDYEFGNVDSEEIIPVGSAMEFNGTSDYLDTGIKLLDEDKSFVLAVDFEFTQTTNTAVLFSCYESTGFIVRYNNNPTVQWNNTGNIVVANGKTREMLIIRKRAGDNNLYLYASNRSGMEIEESVISNSLTVRTNAPLSFGANVQTDGFIGSYGAGKIHWAKIWWGDLGESICRDLACWTRSDVVVQAASNEGSEYAFRMFRRTDNNNYVNCCFLMRDLLDFPRRMTSMYEDANIGGWETTELREWANTRFYNALPEQWRMLMQEVYITSTIGGGSVEMTTVKDYVWAPSCKEVGWMTGDAPYANESESTFSLFTNNASRMKYMNGTVMPWWLRSPYYSTNPDLNRLYYNTVTSSGSINLSQSNNGNSTGVCLGFCI